MQFDPQKTIFLIDGSSFLYRAYYGLRPMHTKTGIPVQAVFSFVRMIKKLIATFDPQRIALVWDSKGKTTRHEMFPEYKATRQAPPSDIFDQKKYIMEFANLIGLPQIAQPGIEADDIMYSIAQERKKDGDMIVFITSDKDMGQALDAQVVMFDPFKDEVITQESFEKKRGFPVSKLPFFYAILGDSSDNIPGVKGIGEKGALDLVTQFASLQDLFERVDAVSKARTKQLLIDQKENALLSERLFLLQYHPSGFTRENLSFNKKNWINARPLFAQLDFASLLKDLAQEYDQMPIVDAAQAPTLQKYNFKCITSMADLAAVCAQIKEKGACAIDTETDGLDALTVNLVGVSVCTQEGESFYIPCGHTTSELQLSVAQVVEALKPIMEDPAIKKYFHNAKFDQLVLYAHGITVRGLAFDSMLAARLVLKDWQSVSLKSLSEYYFNEPMLSFKEVVKDAKLKDFSQVPLSLATAYAAADAHQTFRLQSILTQALKEEKMNTLYEQMELPIEEMLFEMEARGILIDTEELKQLGQKVTAELVTIEGEIITLVGSKHEGINFNSPRQVEQLLFVDLGLPPKKKSAKGTGYSTDQEVLEELSSLSPVPALIIRYRELSKLKNTYIDALPSYVNPKTGRIHTTYSQIATATGRLASADPNLQNIPIGSGYGIAIRAAFKPEPGHVFLSADYSQIELRVLAHLSNDENLKEAFLNGQDIHAQTAASLFAVGIDQVTSSQRQMGKRLNFSILYGLTPYGLSKDLGISYKDAKIYIERYFQQYPGVQRWMDMVIEQAKNHGYVVTHWARKRYVPAIYERNQALYQEACRVAINTVAQGTAAEIMKMGMINVHQAIAKAGIDAHVLLQIHDELLLSVAGNDQRQAEELVKQVLESVVTWQVPLVVTTRIGADWAQVSK